MTVKKAKVLIHPLDCRCSKHIWVHWDASEEDGYGCGRQWAICDCCGRTHVLEEGEFLDNFNVVKERK